MLEELAIDHSNILDSFSTTYNAIAGLANLRALSFLYGYCRKHDNLHNMLSHLRSDVVTLSFSIHHNVGYDDTGDPVILLAGLVPHF